MKDFKFAIKYDNDPYECYLPECDEDYRPDYIQVEDIDEENIIIIEASSAYEAKRKFEKEYTFDILLIDKLS